MGLPMALLGYYCLSIYYLSIYRVKLFCPGVANPPRRQNIEYCIMPPRTECNSTFLWSLKEISGINDRPLLRTDQKHALTKTVLGNAGQSIMFAPTQQQRNTNVPFDRISRTKTVLGGAGQSSMFAPQKQPRKQECSI